MPYITQERRKDPLDERSGNFKFAPGDLNYVLTKVIHDFISENGLSYTNCFNVNLEIDSIVEDLRFSKGENLLLKKAIKPTTHLSNKLRITINDAHHHNGTLNNLFFIALLNDVQREFYRVVVAPYEDKKRKENGSVSELDKVLNDKRAH